MSVADRPERRNGAVREFLAAKQYAELRLATLELPRTLLYGMKCSASAPWKR